MLFIVSLFAAPIGFANAHADTAATTAATCRSQSESQWQPATHEVRVRAYGAVRAREVASVRVLGRCVVKNAPEGAQPVLYVPFGSQLDNSDDQDVAAARAESKGEFGQPAALGLGPADLHDLRASVTQLERPPRV
jgi:hypothetical protein